MADETPEKTVNDETVAEETVAEEVVVEEAAVEETPVAEVAEAPVAEVEETPVAEVAEAPVAEGEETPVAEVEEEAPAPVVKPSRSQRHVSRPERRTRSKVVREKPATRKPITRTEKPDYERGRRQERRGVVISDKADKTIIVKVDVIKSHPKYKKVIRSTVKFHAHDEANTAGVGDKVRIVETRPLSKLKHWRLAEIVEKAK
jgi:small subunit ribosomal protein S17